MMGLKNGAAFHAWAVGFISSSLLVIFPCSYRKENNAHLITAKLIACRYPKDYQQQNVFMSLIRIEIYCSLSMFPSLFFLCSFSLDILVLCKTGLWDIICY